MTYSKDNLFNFSKVKWRMWEFMGTLYQKSTPNKFTIYKLYYTIILQGLSRVSYMFVFKEQFDSRVRLKLKILKEKRF